LLFESIFYFSLVSVLFLSLSALASCVAPSPEGEHVKPVLGVRFVVLLGFVVSQTARSDCVSLSAFSWLVLSGFVVCFVFVFMVCFCLLVFVLCHAHITHCHFRGSFAPLAEDFPLKRSDFTEIRRGHESEAGNRKSSPVKAWREVWQKLPMFCVLAGLLFSIVVFCFVGCA